MGEVTELNDEALGALKTEAEQAQLDLLGDADTTPEDDEPSDETSGPTITPEQAVKGKHRLQFTLIRAGRNVYHVITCLCGKKYRGHLSKAAVTELKSNVLGEHTKALLLYMHQ